MSTYNTPSLLGKRQSLELDPNLLPQASSDTTKTFVSRGFDKNRHEDKKVRLQDDFYFGTSASVSSAKPKVEILEGPPASRQPKARKDFQAGETKELRNCYYYHEDGLRKVFPYFFKFQTFAKGRWLKRTIYEIFATEFQDKPKEYYKQAIQVGAITVNGNAVPLSYKLRNADVIEHLIHRHEPPVSAEPIQIINRQNKHDPHVPPVLDDGLIIINKPSSIPIHPTGRYHHNTVLHILRHDHPEVKEVSPCNRIDRLTSGIALFSRKKAVSTALMKDMQDRVVDKFYLARVRGEFPADYVEVNQPIKTMSFKLGLNMVSPDGKPCKTGFKRLSYNGRTSVVWCTPFTGRTHQIRVHLQYLGYPIANDPIYCTDLWGPSYGKGGCPESDAKDIVERLKVKEYVHLDHVKVEGTDEEWIDVWRSWYKPWQDGKAVSDYGGEKPWERTLTRREVMAVEVCRECGERKRGRGREDPKKEYLQIWLHSVRYVKKKGGEGEVGYEWEYETEWPEWAGEKFEGDRDLEERFWEHGGKWDGKGMGMWVAEGGGDG